MTLVRYLPRFRRASRALSELEVRESWSRSEIESYQLERINEQWQLAIKHVPFFAKLFSSTSLPEKFESIAHFSQTIPITEKSQINYRSEDFLSGNRAAGKWHRTGGSTGQPLRIFRSTDSHCRMLWQKYRMEQSWGIDFFDRKAFVWGHAASFAPGLAGKVQRLSLPCVDWLRNRIRLNAYQLGAQDLASYLEEIRRKKVKVLYGYSSAITLLAVEAKRKKIDLPDLKLAILTAEPADTSMLATCEDGFGAPATIEYGSVECGIIATGTPDGTLRVREDAIYLETIPRSDQRYDLVVTVLDNSAFPLFRYSIEDITDEPLSHVSAGFAVLKNVSGRSNDVLIAQSGRPIHPLAIKHAIELHKNVRRFKAHQTKNGNVELIIEAEGSVTQHEFDDAKKRLEELIENHPVSIQIVSNIPVNIAGKHRWVTSDLAPQLD